MSNSTRKQYNKVFTEELSRLNDRQREAVEQIEGPVLVIAGPGTGKTHILSARIGRILLNTDTQAHNILCLTFTDAGVHAMRKRLLSFIGPEAHRVHIYTFHSFCNNIIQDNLDLFGRHDLEPLSDLERVEIIRKIIDDLPFNHILKKGRADVYFYENHLYDLFQRMKSEDWAVDDIHQQIDNYLEDLPKRKEYIYQITRGTFKKGDIKQAKLDDVIDKMDRLRAATNLFPQYLKAMEQMRRYDFDDMILWVLNAFKKHPSLLRAYQEQYLYFLVDEYQDTNGAQNGILQKLTEYWENPNIFIVGDDDQSIYEFQGARLKNITDFYTEYKAFLKLVLLKDNYRSSQQILDTSKAVITHNEKRLVNSLKSLGLNKNLVAKNNAFANSHVIPTIREYKNRIQEDSDIVHEIEQLHKSNFPMNEVAIIYAKHRQAENIITLLEKKGIPYNTKRRVNILNQPLIQNLRNLLEYINLEYNRPHSGEHFIFRILHFDFLKIHPRDIANLSIFQAQLDWKRRPKWRDLLSDEAQLKALKLRSIPAILRFSRLIDQFTIDYVNYSLPILLERIINRMGLLQHILNSPQKAWLLQLMHSFFDFVKEENSRKTRLSIPRLLDMLSNMEANRLPIEINRSVYAKNGVNLLTAHSAKGLEFECVFMIDCIKDNWEPRSRSRNRFSLPDTLTYSGEEDALEARRRLFYVAMTRAKEQLYISYSAFNAKEKPIQKALFIDEIIEGSEIPITHKTLETDTLLDAQMMLLLEAQKPQIPSPDKDTIDALLEGFTLSVSAMNRYLKCPLSFYYEYILRVPTLMSPAAAYGTAMHYAFMKLFEKMQQSEERIFPSASWFLKYFEQEMQRQEMYFTPKEYQHRFEKGRATLLAYYNQHLHKWPKKVLVEYELRHVEVEGVPIKGVIDRVDILAEAKGHVEDYKTGNMVSSKTRPPTNKVPYGGSYWRQLLFYKILYESASKTQESITTGAIAYLEMDKKGVFPTKKIKLKPEDTAFVKGLIVQTWQKIQAHQFEEGCGEDSCVWCQFVKNNITPDSFADTDIEELDDM